ncbi:MAG: hypothetical protein DMD79_02960 [Candidatus Rokuibacteriota bacterium]|nr:MAG: hypothetical protein DMD79_02960 [Candidatus Rokubacteria bacterium]
MRRRSASPGVWSWRRWIGMGRWPRGSWMTRRSPRGASTRVGVAHQYCGPLGKPANCQVAVTVTSTNEAVSVPTAYQLYLPESWARDRNAAASGSGAAGFGYR